MDKPVKDIPIAVAAGFAACYEKPPQIFLPYSGIKAVKAFNEKI
ncbi:MULTISPECIES: hypothetical protein [unclassified Chelatococcus]|nr:MULTISPECIES: hypothetical protein [unclassified Chelatococcus]